MSKELPVGERAMFEIEFDRLPAEARRAIQELMMAKGFSFPIGIERLYVHGRRLEDWATPDPPDGLLKIVPAKK